MGDAGVGQRTPACLLPPSLQGLPSGRGPPPPFLHLPRFTPDDAGPLFVSHASRHRFQTSQETASFHFQLCQMGLLCNQTCLSPRIDPKAPSNLMTFPHALLSSASCLGW